MKIKNIVFFVVLAGVNLLAAFDDSIQHWSNEDVSAFQKGNLVVEYDKKTKTYNAFKEKISRFIVDNEMLRIKRDLVAYPTNAEKAYWQLYDRYWSEINNDREPNEVEN